MQIKLTFLKLCFTKANQNIMEFRSEQLLFLIDVYVYEIAQFNIHCASFFLLKSKAKVMFQRLQLRQMVQRLYNYLLLLHFPP